MQLKFPFHMHFISCHLDYLRSSSSTDLHPIQVLRFFANTANLPIADVTTVFVRVCSPSKHQDKNINKLLLLHAGTP